MTSTLTAFNNINNLYTLTLLGMLIASIIVGYVAIYSYDKIKNRSRTKRRQQR